MFRFRGQILSFSELPRSGSLWKGICSVEDVFPHVDEDEGCPEGQRNNLRVLRAQAPAVS